MCLLYYSACYIVISKYIYIYVYINLYVYIHTSIATDLPQFTMALWPDNPMVS